LGNVIIYIKINITHNENIIVLVICVDVKPESLKSFPLRIILCSVYNLHLTVFSEKFPCKFVERVCREKIK